MIGEVLVDSTAWIASFIEAILSIRKPLSSTSA
jgi:hypothetical protein